MIEPSAWIVDYETATGVSYGLEVKSYWTAKRLRTFDKRQVEYLLGQEALGGDTLHAVRNVEVMPLYTEDHIVDANKKVCGTCKHYMHDKYKPSWCGNDTIISTMLESDERAYLTPPPDFGCNLWEAK